MSWSTTPGATFGTTHAPRPPHGRPGAGFTMIELLVVMAVLGVLAAAIMPLGEALVQGHKERQLRQNLQEIRTALDRHKRYADQGRIAPGPTGSGYPANLAVLVEGVVDLSPQGQGQRLYLLRRLPRDPFAPADVPAEASWRLRSYASPPENPQPGADVFDVLSSSDAVALDGSRYADW